MKVINNIALWASILTLLFLGIRADTRSIQRDISQLEQIQVLTSVADTSQKAIIQILKSTP